MEKRLGACHFRDGGKYTLGGQFSKITWSKSDTLSSKVTRRKRTIGLAQAVEHLHSKNEALSSNPSTIKKIYI
jgi:hypothetical protein